jgi:hypothetical protein
MEAIWVAAEMGAGGGYARVTLALRRESRGNWRRARRRERSRPASISAAQRYCGRDRIRTCEGNAGDFTGRSDASPRFPSHPPQAPLIGLTCTTASRQSRRSPGVPARIAPSRAAWRRAEGRRREIPAAE